MKYNLYLISMLKVVITCVKQLINTKHVLLKLFWKYPYSNILYYNNYMTACESTNY